MADLDTAGVGPPDHDHEVPERDLRSVSSGSVRSEAQHLASQRNGAKGRGPVTPEGKAVSSGNAITHGGYSLRAVVRTGALREDPAEYEQNLKAFLGAMQPRNAAAERAAVRIFAEYHKLDRVDRYEVLALESAGRMPEVDPLFDQRLELAELHYDSAEADREWWEKMLKDYDTDSQSLSFTQWWWIWGAIADTFDVDFRAQVEEARGASDEAREEFLPTLRSAIEEYYRMQNMRVGDVIDERCKQASREADRLLDELDAFKEPPTEEDYGAKVARSLIEGGFFDRLARPRSTSHRAIRQAWDQFTRFQDLPSDDADVA